MTKISEQKLIRLTVTLMIDYLKELSNEDINKITIADIQNYCTGWIKENVKEFVYEMD